MKIKLCFIISLLVTMCFSKYTLKPGFTGSVITIKPGETKFVYHIENKGGINHHIIPLNKTSCTFSWLCEAGREPYDKVNEYYLKTTVRSGDRKSYQFTDIKCDWVFSLYNNKTYDKPCLFNIRYIDVDSQYCCQTECKKPRSLNSSSYQPKLFNSSILIMILALITFTYLS